jgi:hypothetical protein
MDQQVNLAKQVFEKRQYDRTINTSFTQLVSPIADLTGSALPTVDQFFDFYNQLFFDIPKFGEVNSHEYLIRTSQEYIGTTAVITDELQALIDEVTELRQSNLDLNQQVLNLQSSVSNISNIQI